MLPTCLQFVATKDYPNALVAKANSPRRNTQVLLIGKEETGVISHTVSSRTHSPTPSGALMGPRIIPRASSAVRLAAQLCHVFLSEVGGNVIVISAVLALMHNLRMVVRNA